MIVLVRHGLTDHSRNYVASGQRHRQVDIDAEGVRQARRAALLLSDYACQRAVCSSYSRTRTSARLIVGDGIPVLVRPTLDELDYGTFDGGPWLSYGAWLARQGLHAQPPGGAETWAGALARALRSVAAIDAESIPTVIVCHGYLWSALAQYLREGVLPTTSRLGAPAPYATPLAPSEGQTANFLREWTKHCAPFGSFPSDTRRL